MFEKFWMCIQAFPGSVLDRSHDLLDINTIERTIFGYYPINRGNEPKTKGFVQPIFGENPKKTLGKPVTRSVVPRMGKRLKWVCDNIQQNMNIQQIAR